MSTPRHVFRLNALCHEISRLVRSVGWLIAHVLALSALLATGAVAEEKASAQVQELMKHPGAIFARELADVPGKNLVVVALEFPPKPSGKSKAPQQYIGHRHPGSVYVYVLKGAVNLAIDDQPVQTVPAGKSFFEPVGALHTVAESASTTEPASAIAVLIVPDGAPIATPVKASSEGHSP